MQAQMKLKPAVKFASHGPRNILLMLSSCLLVIAPARAKVLTVTTLLDGPPGSLRNQVTSAMPGDEIQFGVKGTISLTSEIPVANPIWIHGPRPADVTISGANASRIFDIAVSGVTVSGLTLRDGKVVGADGATGGLSQDGLPGDGAAGGAILCNGSLTLSNCWFDGNEVHGGRGGKGGPVTDIAGSHPGKGGAGGDAKGGALACGDLIVLNTTFSGNIAIGGDGGIGGDNLSHLAMAGGTGGVGGTGNGGAIGHGGIPAFTNCTFSGNVAWGGTGGVGGVAAIQGTGGTGGDGGDGTCGGIDLGSFPFPILVSCTVVSNEAHGGLPGTGGSGNPVGSNGNLGNGFVGGLCGFYILATCPVKMGNTIAAVNYASTQWTNIYAAVWDLGYNFFGDDEFIGLGGVGNCITSSTRYGTVAAPLDPLLGPLAQNGGGRPTHAPLNNSPVIGYGYSFGTTNDERGAERPFGSPAQNSSGDGSEVGAFEFGSPTVGLGMTGTNVVVTWPAAYGDFKLQASPGLETAASWYDVTDAPVQVEDTFVLSNSVASPMQFYRLVHY